MNELHIKCTGVSRINNFNDLLNSNYNRYHSFGLIVRDKRNNNKILGFCTNLISSDSCWCYIYDNNIEIFKSIWIIGNQLLKIENPNCRGISCWLSHQYTNELRWLLDNNIKIRSQFTTMYINHDFHIQDKYRYCSSAWY